MRPVESCTFLKRYCDFSLGNARIGDASTGFDTKFPDRFFDSRETPSGDFEIQTKPKLASTAGSQPYFKTFKIQLWQFGTRFPDFASRTRSELHKVFLENPSMVWWEGHSNDPCVEVFLADSGNLYQALATWGSGKGVIVLGERDPDVLRGMREIISELRLAPGACAWLAAFSTEARL